MDYSIGVDFGTLSARAVLADMDGGICGESEYRYPHGVISENLPEGYHLQDPEDYLLALGTVVRDALQQAGVSPSSVRGIGIDFTSCTLLPVDREMVPLCRRPEFRSNPHAYVKLWKHHSTTAEAEEINRHAEEAGDAWLPFYGGKMTAEMGLPKILETCRNAPDVYAAAYRFLEAGDYISYLLTGKEVHAACFADYKYAHGKTGFPEGDFYLPMLRKLSGDIRYAGEIAGHVSPEGAALTGLRAGTAVALSMIDCHASLPALNMTRAGDLLIVLGTSACHLAHGERLAPVKGICGGAFGAVIPGLATYEAGQPTVGDLFDWFVKNQVPGSCHEEAAARGMDIHAFLSEKASALRPGESGLVGLDWLSGNRSILSDASRKGVMTGITLATRPWELYRAWLEAAAFGTKVIVDNYEDNGIRLAHIKATGGIAVRNPLFMQILTDVLGREIAVAAVGQSAALGSAIYGAAAAGIYPTLQEAAERMSCRDFIRYRPDAENVGRYRTLYLQYRRLHDLFGSSDR